MRGCLGSGSASFVSRVLPLAPGAHDLVLRRTVWHVNQSGLDALRIPQLLDPYVESSPAS